MDIMLPTPAVYDVETQAPPPLPMLRGCVMAVLNNGWACMEELTQYLEEELRDRGAVDVVHVKTPHSQPTPREHIGDIAAKVAGAITGLGN